MKLKHSTWPKLRLILLTISILLFLGFTFQYILLTGKLPVIQVNLRWILFFAACSLALFSGFVSYYEYHGVGNQEGIIRRFYNGKYVCLTFDDGPSPKYTPEILDILKKYKVKASFFVVGRHVKKYPEIVKRIIDEGHDIGNHTYKHKDLVPATKASVIKEIKMTEEILMKTTSVSTNLFRPPRGIYNQSVRKTLVERNYEIILWNLSSCDWRGNSPKGILKRIKRFVKDGSIILFHDSGALIRREGGSRGNTVKALPLVIEYLLEQDYKVVPVSELLLLNEQEPEAEPLKI